MVPETYDYAKLFGLWKGKGSNLDWEAKLLE